VQREDDRPETVRRRLVVYHGNIGTLMGHYRAQGLLHEVEGQGAIEEVYANIMKVLKGQGGKKC
jgi:adenylate kinase